MAEIAERASQVDKKNFLYFLYFCGTKKYYPHEIIMSRRNSRNSRKGFAGASNYNFCYFLYFFDERSGKADDRGTKNFPHEIKMSHRNSRNNRNGFASGG